MLSTIALTPQGGFVMAQKRDNGTGTIYQRANKTWVGKIYLGLDETGKEKFKYFSGKTEAEVKKFVSITSLVQELKQKRFRCRITLTTG